MVRHYCQLVQDFSLKGRSHLISKLLIHIDADLTADLSLSALAKLLNVNSSYLSALFKKELGSTLTEYVSTRRVKYAMFLLSTTNLQVQAIAQHCGIPDVNYFTRTFKRYAGVTPKEYRAVQRAM
jgi:YesN/AraC family two-component response regulator